MASAEVTSENKSRRQPRTLRISYHHERPKLLFDLPRELRDVIWALALDEPILYNKQHKPGCPFRNHAEAYQIPPAVTHNPLQNSLTNPQQALEQLNQKHLVKCKSLCVRRQGFGLLMGVSKQVQLEAAEYFWPNTTLCFVENMCGRIQSTALVRQLKAIAPAALRRIRRLAIWSREDNWPVYPVINTTYTRASLPEILQSMPNLSHLELPVACLEKPWDEHHHLFTLPRLSSLRICAMRGVDHQGHEICVAAGGQWEMPECARSVTSPPPKPKSQWCVPCQDTLQEMTQLVKCLQKSRAWGHQDWANVSSQLEELDAAQPSDEPYLLKARLHDKYPEHEMRVWGLPIHSAATRAAEARKVARAEYLASVARKAPVVPRYESPESEEDEDDFRVTGNKALNRKHRPVEKRVDHEKRLDERKNHHQNVANAAAKDAKREKIAQDQGRRQDQEERSEERKAAGKRAARKEMARRVSFD